jgi:geranylgeranyl pyrophosphate synthase
MPSSLAHRSPVPSLAWARDPLVVALRQRIEQGLAGLTFAEEPASRAVRHLIGAGGKRLRPLLVYLGGQLVGASLEQLDGLAEAAELVHVASLLHDDLMDGAAMRRGHPAAWRAIGPKAAVLGGDLAHVMALQRVRRVPAPAMERFLAGVDAMVRSQSLEIEQEAKLSGGLPAWRAVAYGKTAALCGWCAEVGAITAGEPRLAAPLRGFGEGLGLAFQAVDDLLDLVPGMDPGKAAFADLRAGVPSLPILMAAASCPSTAAEIEALWAARGEPSQALAAAVRRHGAAPALALVERELAQARALLHALPAGAANTILHAMLDTLSHRAAGCLVPLESP